MVRDRPNLAAASQRLFLFPFQRRDAFSAGDEPSRRAVGGDVPGPAHARQLHRADGAGDLRAAGRDTSARSDHRRVPRRRDALAHIALRPVAYDEGGLLLFGTLAIGLLPARDALWIVQYEMDDAGRHDGGICLRQQAHGGPRDCDSFDDHRGDRAVHPSHVSIATESPGMAIPGLYHGKRIRSSPRAHFSSRRLITFSPWLIRNTIWCGNPVFPEATSIFGKAHWTDTQVERWKRANHLPRDDQQNIPGQLRAAWDQILGDGRFNYLAACCRSAFRGWPCAATANRSSSACSCFFQAIFWLFFTHLQKPVFSYCRFRSARWRSGKLSGQVWGTGPDRLRSDS